MADYLPEPQFSYTKQLEAYDALLEKRKRKQKWGTIFNNVDAMMNPNHVASGTFAENEKRMSGSYGTSLAQESKRLSLLGKAEKEGIHQEISMRLQNATKNKRMANKSDFDTWFETLGPHFSGEYKKYFDIWKAGIGEEREEAATIEKRARFDRFRFENDEKDAKTAADKLTAADIDFKDAEVDKLYLEHLPAYATYYNQVNMGMVSGPDNLTSLRMKIARSVANQDWTDDVKEAVITKVWATLNKSVTGGERIPTTSTALSVDKSLREQAAASTTRLQKTANKRVRTAYTAFVADKDNEPKNVEDYVNFHRQLSDQLDAINYAGTYAERTFVEAVMDKFEKRYKGYESQRSKRYDPEKAPTYRVAVDAEGNVVFATNKQIQSGGLSPVESTRGSTARARPSQAFIQIAVEMSNTEPDQDKFMSVVNKIYDLGLLGITDPEDAKIVQKIIKEINDRAKKNDAAGLAALREILEVNILPGGGEDKTPTDAKERIQILRNAGVDKETIRLILIKEGLIDG
jgi:hypothetical protein